MSATCSKDMIVGKMHSREIITQDCQRVHARLSELEDKFQNPLDLRECSGESVVLNLGGAATHGGLLRTLRGNKVR
ncbi:hypothetical protein PIB30_001492 [Stylosanthes scabra]|uniref:Uncharacterized protein n=1 Tax=Stylosanthes scabra TaxID=79078 RepID=A0ABU6Q2K0_9FABA|nr:hypothetical protein [Stylosanthes scabra]